MRIKNNKSTKLRIFGLLTAAAALFELLLCLRGPIAFIPKPSLVLFPVVSSNLTDEESGDVSAFLEREMAQINSYAIRSQSFIEEFFTRTDPEFDLSRLKPDNHIEALEVARELEIERIATSYIYKYYKTCYLSISIHDVKTEEVINRCNFTSDTLENLFKGIGKEGEVLDFEGSLKNQTKGINFTDFLVLGLLALQLSLGILALFGKEPGVLTEIGWAFALILFLFSYIHAQSANMDYMQRFIATGGMFRLAQSTALEQFYSFLRYGPILLINGAYYIYRNIIKNRDNLQLREKHWTCRWIAAWSLPWVVLSAVMFALSFPSLVSLEGYGILAWFSLIPLFLVILTRSSGMGIFYGTFFGVLQALIINYWHGTYKYVTLHLITITFFIQFLIFMTILVWVIRKSGKWGFLIAAVGWVFFDYCRSIGIMGYPWGLIGTSQYKFLPFIQIASITGVWGLGFVIILCNASLAWTIAAPALGWNWKGRTLPVFNRIKIPGLESLKSYIEAKISVIRKPGTFFPAAIFMAVFTICLISGGIIFRVMQIRLYENPNVPEATIVLIQQNTDPRRHEYEENLQKLMELTDDAIRSLPNMPDLVAWPEGGTELDITYWSDPARGDTHWGKYMAGFIEYQKGLGTWLLSGTQDHKMVPGEDGELKRINYNSSVLIDPEGEIKNFYHKMKLVPFSERFPLDTEKWAWLYEFFQKLDISHWAVGEERLVFQHEKMRFNTPICFEDVFSDHVRRFVLQDVDIILNISNDYWSLSPVEGRQHGILSLFRAVENHRPLLRSTSSGYTVYIDATGRIHPGSPEPYTEGYTIARVPLPEKTLTAYTKWGDWFPRLCGLLSGLAFLILVIINIVIVVLIRHRKGSSKQAEEDSSITNVNEPDINTPVQANGQSREAM